MKICGKCAQEFKKRDCEHCAKIYKAAWRAANPGYMAAWRAANPGYNAAYYAANKEREQKRRSDWYAANTDREKSSAAAWKAKNPWYQETYYAFYRTKNRGKVNSCNARRRAARLQATPRWAEEFFISEIYDLAQLRTEATGVNWAVDHIVPLKSKLVCGLHCEDNLRVITSDENLKKSNRFWPDMP